MHDSKAGRGPDALDELDLALAHALQMVPRASWAELAPILGADPATLARRWRRLESTGSAWVTCFPGMGTGKHTVTTSNCVALVELTVAPGRIPEAIAAVRRHRIAINIEYMTGNRDLLMCAAARDAESLAHYLQVTLPSVPGITGIRVQLPLRLYKDSGAWRLRALDHGQRQALAALPRPAATGSVRPPDADDLALLAHLGPNGRLGTAELARRLGVSGVTAARRLARLTAAGFARYRCEVARSLTGWPICATWWLRVPAADLEDVAAKLTTLGDVHMCASITGSANLLVVLWLRHASDAPVVEADWSRRFPRMEVVDSSVTIQVVKRMGRLVGPDGRSIGYVPLGFAEDLPADLVPEAALVPAPSSTERNLVAVP
ncbi:Lrp/AsnC family transcriptional regulator [Yinghuangia soli]|uniref:Lrp/AsnC family transcriptional regulator n=1 Tax=Yinghuangia soli TaxID=2908204 RepID=A0AA41Q4W7_9ACTN|nr:Lrp/AsnC family transcriptional regulator [Yinghuangia soli]MCF2531625.1 Lrp/AsnC family transcriptional regulator [Yinghuangia soli]